MVPMPQLGHVRLLAVIAALFAVPSLAHAQFIDDYFDPALAVPDSGTYAPSVQQAVEEGYRQLDMVTGPEDEDLLEAAREAFDRALDEDGDNVHAWNGKGVYELRKDEGWLILLESLKKIFERDHISMAINAFERVLESDPDFHAARYNLALAHRQKRSEGSVKDAVRELERLMEEAPEYGRAPMLLALTYRDLGDFEKMRETIERAPDSEAFPEAVQQLVLAYALFNQGDREAGAEAYWQGLDAIDSEQAADIYWHDIRPLVLPPEDEEYRSLEVQWRPNFIRSYWTELADQSFVPVDERVAVHYERLHYAREHYRVDIPHRRHYSQITAYVPRFQTGFDDRGVIYLRHGEPDDVARYQSAEVERNVSWKYEQPDGDPLLFHFVSDEDVNDYKLVRRLSDAITRSQSASLGGDVLLDRQAGSRDRIAGQGVESIGALDARQLAGREEELRDLYRSRGHLDPEYDRAGMDLDPQILEMEEARLAEDIQLATRTQSYTPEVQSEPFPYPLRPVPFKAPSGGTELAFYYALPTGAVTVLPYAGSGSAIDYRYQYRLDPIDDPMAVGKRNDREIRIASRNPIPQAAGVMLPAVERVTISPGEYRYGVKLTDLNSGEFGVHRGLVRIDNLGGTDAMSMSGLLLASSVEPADDPSNPFVRWGQLKVLPLPSGVFKREQTVFAYYEVYGLSPDDSGNVRYRTTYTVAAPDGGRNVVARFFSAVGELLGGDEERGRVTYSFEREAPVQDPLLEYVSLDVSQSPPGQYTVTVEIEDLVSGTTRRRTAPVTLVE